MIMSTATWTATTQDRTHSPLGQPVGIHQMPIRTKGQQTNPQQSLTSTQDSTSTTNSHATTSIQRSHESSDCSNTYTEHDPTHVQRVITKPKDNIPFGDLLSSPKPKNTTRFLFQNVNGIYKGGSWNDLSSLSRKLAPLQVDVFGAAETNINWNHTRNQQAKNILQRHSKICSVSTSSNAEKNPTSYQPGGTISAMFGKYTGRISSNIRDPTGLGRWSGFKLTTNLGQPLNILTVYQSTKSDGIHTAYQQQAHYFRTLGVHNPDPRKLLLKHLSQLLSTYHHNKEEIIILIDANDGIKRSDYYPPSSQTPTLYP